MLLSITSYYITHVLSLYIISYHLDINASLLWELLNDGDIYGATKLILISSCLIDASNSYTVERTSSSSRTRPSNIYHTALSEHSKVQLKEDVQLTSNSIDHSNLLSVLFLSEVR
jgi:hypothetical protein